jgi:hypothetical protein
VWVTVIVSLGQRGAHCHPSLVCLLSFFAIKHPTIASVYRWICPLQLFWRYVHTEKLLSDPYRCLLLPYELQGLLCCQGKASSLVVKDLLAAAALLSIAGKLLVSRSYTRNFDFGMWAYNSLQLWSKMALHAYATPCCFGMMQRAPVTSVLEQVWLACWCTCMV